LSFIPSLTYNIMIRIKAQVRLLLYVVLVMFSFEISLLLCLLYFHGTVLEPNIDVKIVKK